MAEPATSELTTPSASPSYFVRLGKLSAKVQERALQQSLVRARHARDATYTSVAQITSTLDLLESARTSLGTASNQIGGASEQLLQRWTEWKQKHAGAGQTESEPDGSKDEAEVRAEAFGNWLNVVQPDNFCISQHLQCIYCTYAASLKWLGIPLEQMKEMSEHHREKTIRLRLHFRGWHCVVMPSQIHVGQEWHYIVSPD